MSTGSRKKFELKKTDSVTAVELKEVKAIDTSDVVGRGVIGEEATEAK